MELAVDNLAKKFGVDSEDPGIAVLVMKPGRVLFMKGYGLASLKDKTPITPKTMFELASVSKTMTATAVLKLHERGAWSIEDDVRTYLPELPNYAKERPILLKDMLRHVSGLPSYFDLQEGATQPKKFWSNEDLTGEFARQKKAFPLSFPTGQKYEYNNTNYMLLATCLMRKMKQPYSAILREEIFAPAGMTHTFLYENPGTVPAHPVDGYNHALGYEFHWKDKKWVESWGTTPERHEKDLEVGDGGIWTNLEDMAKWDTALREHKLLKPATMKLALTPSKTHDGKTNPYGLGWILYADKSGNLYGNGHDGYWGGFSTSYYNYHAHQHTVVLLSNRGKQIDLDKFWEALDSIVVKFTKGD